jgi:class 3 adenylate cyclase
MDDRYTVRLTTSITLDAPVARLWPLLSDTDRTNRLIGLPIFERTEPDEDLTQIIHGHYLGVPVSWREYPFEWIFEQWFSVERAFSSPFPIERLRTSTRLTPLDSARTRVDVSVDVIPRNLVGAFGGRLLIGQQMLRAMRRVYESFGALVRASDNLAVPPRIMPDVNAERLRQSLARLTQFGVTPALIERLATHLRAADDPDVLKMRPFALADAWGADRLDVLRLFLYATRAGLLDLEWDVLCPNCRGPSVRAGTLADLRAEAHCRSCNIRYDVGFDESVELRFSVSPTVREAVDASYCIGGPANTRHIAAQVWLPPAGAKTLALRLVAGTYRVRTRQLAGTTLIEATETAYPTETALRVTPDAITAAEQQVAAGDVRMHLENTTHSPLLVVLEQTAWSAQAASAALVTALAEFRQLFSSEVLAPGLGIAVRTLTFLFSDLKDSTRIYEQIGDSPAYARVRDHFDVMQATIARHRGALVKTIGDAVMAVFTRTDDSVRAALEIQRTFTEGEIAKGNPALRVKLGLHRGPCIAVNANDLLDYFGSTVNIAARVQGESLGGDIVLTEAIMGDPVVREVLAEFAPASETFRRDLKGITQSPVLYRLWVYGGPVLAATGS